MVDYSKYVPAYDTDPISGNPIPKTSFGFSSVQVPTEIQSRTTKTIQTHTATSIGAGATTANAAFIDVDGYSELAVTMLNDAGTATIVYAYWSNDGTTTHGIEQIIATGTSMQRVGIVTTKARYVKVAINNTDTASHVISAWAFLKA